MPVTRIDKDPTALTLTVHTEHAATPEQVWQLWANPRALERWWGPPTYPATVLDHDLSPGGRITYVMTGPEGDRHGGCWSIVHVDEPRSLAFDDGFADEDGTLNPELPVSRIAVSIAPGDGGTAMAIETTFPSVEAMEQLLAMGMDEGMREAAGQIDEILAEVAA
jgi:uncharacterized protein YndB with AHSA1/START domain